MRTAALKHSPNHPQQGDSRLISNNYIPYTDLLKTYGLLFPLKKVTVLH